MQLAISHVDVFSNAPFCGNPVAVVHDADQLTEAKMQELARWLNLSETTFLLQPTDPRADYRVRIFTPASELAFAGHPTLGTCQAYLRRHGTGRSIPEVVQQCQAGLIRIRVDGRRASFAAPPLHREEPDDNYLTLVRSALGVRRSQMTAASWLDNGSKWLGVIVDSAETVLGIRPDHTALARLCKVGVIGRAPSRSDVLFEVRAFAASIGVPEDPVTGSLNASFAVWMKALGGVPDGYVVGQGTCLGRVGRVHVHHEPDTVWVGGKSSLCIEGTLKL
jgi:PhzF family phenazine biosynthesis protein